MPTRFPFHDMLRDRSRYPSGNNILQMVKCTLKWVAALARTEDRDQAVQAAFAANLHFSFALLHDSSFVHIHRPAPGDTGGINRLTGNADSDFSIPTWCSQRQRQAVRAGRAAARLPRRREKRNSPIAYFHRTLKLNY